MGAGPHVVEAHGFFRPAKGAGTRDLLHHASCHALGFPGGVPAQARERATVAQTGKSKGQAHTNRPLSRPMPRSGDSFYGRGTKTAFLVRIYYAQPQIMRENAPPLSV